MIEASAGYRLQNKLEIHAGRNVMFAHRGLKCPKLMRVAR